MGDEKMTEELREEVGRWVLALDVARKAKAEAGRAGVDASEHRSAVEEAETKLFEAKRALAIGEKTGSHLGVVTVGDEVIGVIAVNVPPGAGSDARTRAIDDALGGLLDDCARELGGVVAAAPNRFTRERPGRDGEGRTILDVRGRLEGDRVVPALPTAKKR